MCTGIRKVSLFYHCTELSPVSLDSESSEKVTADTAGLFSFPASENSVASDLFCCCFRAAALLRFSSFFLSRFFSVFEKFPLLWVPVFPVPEAKLWSYNAILPTLRFGPSFFAELF